MKAKGVINKCKLPQKNSVKFQKRLAFIGTKWYNAIVSLIVKEERVGRPALLFMLEVKKVAVNQSPKAKKNVGGKKTADRVWDIVKPVADELGLELWDVRYEKEGASWYLKLIIDKEGGINITDCENMSRRCDKLLDEADPIEDSYRLQVSSPGIERELTRDWHFEKCMGEYVLVRFIRPVEEQNGERDFEGVLSGYENGEVSIVLKEAEDDSDGIEMCFNVSETAYIRLADDFEDIGDFDDSDED